MEFVVQLVVMAVFAIACALIAHSRGRSAVGWFFIGLFAGCIGLILVLVLPDLKVERERQERLRLENLRLKERLRKDRQVADRRHAAIEERLGVHDAALGIDTSRALEEPESAPLLDGAAAAPPPPPPPPPPQRNWWYLVGTERVGPVNDARFRTLWRDGSIGPDTMIWTERMPDWRAIRDLPDLVETLDG